MQITLWVTAEMAAEMGCTHHARFMGIVPGFFNPETNLWISRSDLLNPFEDFVVWSWMLMRQLNGEEPDFMFAMGEPI